MTDTETATTNLKLTPFAENIWTVEGPNVSFFGFPYPTRMVVVKLENEGGSWVWSPVSYDSNLAKEMEQAAGGPVKYIVSPNKIHHIFLQPWAQAFPEAKVYASPGLQGRKVIPRELKFTDTLDDEPPASTYGDDIAQVVFRGGGIEEVVFFHKLSRTVIVCDLIQRHRHEDQTGWKGWLMKLDGLVGPEGSTPREWRWWYWLNGGLPKARTALSKILVEWKPDKLIIAHGENATENATEIIQKSLSWMN